MAYTHKYIYIRYKSEKKTLVYSSNIYLLKAWERNDQKLNLKTILIVPTQFGFSLCTLNFGAIEVKRLRFASYQYYGYSI